MAIIQAFRAVRYDPAKVALEQVLTQPYDKITPAMQERYYHASPYNLVRIILGKAQSGDQGGEVYARAGECFRRWRQEGILRQEPEPAVYVYHQRFTAPGAGGGREMERRGFIALGRIEDYSAGVVFRHEQTLARPKQDRLNLLRTTRAHFGQIFVLYSDPGKQVESLLAPRGAPEIEVRDEYGVVHRMWKAADPAVVKAVGESMAEKKLIIADGHHRYETALSYRNERERSGPESGVRSQEKPYEYVMMTFINMDAEGLVILPTHRVVSGLPDFDKDMMLRRAWGYFEIERVPEVNDVATLLARLRDAGAQGTAVLAVAGHDAFLLRAGAGAADALLSALPERQRRLDVVQVHKVLLEHVLGIPEEAIREQRHLNYLRDAEEAVEKARGGANVAFLMNPVRMEQVRNMALAGEVLPQKSTDFYPKLLSGLTIYALE
jgi:uncharacterized protein (DUF1015 family)